MLLTDSASSAQPCSSIPLGTKQSYFLVLSIVYEQQAPSRVPAAGTPLRLRRATDSLHCNSDANFKHPQCHRLSDCFRRCNRHILPSFSSPRSPKRDSILCLVYWSSKGVGIPFLVQGAISLGGSNRCSHVQTRWVSFFFSFFLFHPVYSLRPSLSCPLPYKR